MPIDLCTPVRERERKREREREREVKYSASSSLNHFGVVANAHSENVYDNLFGAMTILTRNTAIING